METSWSPGGYDPSSLTSSLGAALSPCWAERGSGRRAPLLRFFRGFPPDLVGEDLARTPGGDTLCSPRSVSADTAARCASSCLSRARASLNPRVLPRGTRDASVLTAAAVPAARSLPAGPRVYFFSVSWHFGSVSLGRRCPRETSPLPSSRGVAAAKRALPHARPEIPASAAGSSREFLSSSVEAVGSNSLSCKQILFFHPEGGGPRIQGNDVTFVFHGVPQALWFRS